MAVIVPFESPASASIDELVGLVAADMERVNATILSRTGSEVTMIPEVANHLISSGGKRLRPMLTLAMASLTGYSGDGHIKLAASVEFMHTATLLHDDVVDESELRRGKLSARMLWGNEASVLVGDFLLGQAFRMMVEVGSLRALDILSSAAATIAEGEVMQLAAAKNTATTEDEYLAVIRGKTAELFAAACEVGPVIANRPKAEQTACRSVGMNLGIAFQLVDDVLDYGGKAAKLGKNIGDDFREGKITLPVVLAFRRGNDIERGFWIKALERGEIGDGDLDHAIGLMTKHRALEDTLNRAQHYGAMAVDALALFPASADEDRARAGGGVLPGAIALILLILRSALPGARLEGCKQRAVYRLMVRDGARAPPHHEGPGLAQHPRMHPPLRVVELNFLRRAPRVGGIFKDRKAGRARPRHPRQPGAVGGAERRDHLADHRLNARRRRFEVVGTGRKHFHPVFERGARFRPGGRAASRRWRRPAVRRWRRPSAAKHVLGRHGNARIDHHARHFRQGERQQRFADAGHHAGARGEANRNVGAGQPRNLDQALKSSMARPLARANSRSAAAASAEPPPIPAATGSTLSRVKSPSREIRNALAEQLRRLEHQIVGGLATGLRERPGGREMEFGASRQAQAVGAIGERHHAFEVVIAVDAPPNHPQGQVDLGPPVLGQR